MKGWHWIALGTGIATVGGIAYYAYRRMQAAKEEVAMSRHAEAVEEEEETSVKPDPVDVLDETLVDSMDYLLRFYKLAAESKGSMEHPIYEQSMNFFGLPCTNHKNS